MAKGWREAEAVASRNQPISDVKTKTVRSVSQVDSHLTEEKKPYHHRITVALVNLNGHLNSQSFINKERLAGDRFWEITG